MSGRRKQKPKVAEEAAKVDPAPGDTPPERPDQAPPKDAGDITESSRHLVFGLALPLGLLIYEMWRVRQFTVDDSYISFRYSRNLANGLGLVYNAGERVEGYTNFLWTVIIAAGIKVGLEPVSMAKMLGGMCAATSLFLLYRLSHRLRAFTSAPAFAPWLFATSILNSGYSVFGLETPLFVVLILGGLYLFFREEPIFGKEEGVTAPPPKIPWSGLVFGLAGITRPEAPMYIGILVLLLGKGMFSLRNIQRGLLFILPVGSHLLFRHWYYGQWTPNTFGAKTGNIAGQVHGGWAYVVHYVQHEGPILFFALGGLAWALISRRRDLIALTVTALSIAGYVVLVGGDWMPLFRFLVPFEPFCFLLIDITIREAWDRAKADERIKKALVPVALGLAIGLSAYRTYELTLSQRYLLGHEDRFWRMAAGGTAKWLLLHPRGTIAMGDIGYVGYATDYPLLDLLGLVDPVIAKLPGGYTQKIGPGFTDRLMEVDPRYVLLISSKPDCQHPSVAGSIVIYRDPRFLARYSVAGSVPLDDGFAWCFYEDPNGK